MQNIDKLLGDNRVKIPDYLLKKSTVVDTDKVHNKLKKLQERANKINKNNNRYKFRPVALGEKDAYNFGASQIISNPSLYAQPRNNDNEKIDELLRIAKITAFKSREQLDDVEYEEAIKQFLFEFAPSISKYNLYSKIHSIFNIFSDKNYTERNFDKDYLGKTDANEYIKSMEKNIMNTKIKQTLDKEQRERDFEDQLLKQASQGLSKFDDDEGVEETKEEIRKESELQYDTEIKTKNDDIKEIEKQIINFRERLQKINEDENKYNEQISIINNRQTKGVEMSSAERSLIEGYNRSIDEISRLRINYNAKIGLYEDNITKLKETIEKLTKQKTEFNVEKALEKKKEKTELARQKYFDSFMEKLIKDGVITEEEFKKMIEDDLVINNIMDVEKLVKFYPLHKTGTIKDEKQKFVEIIKSTDILNNTPSARINRLRMMYLYSPKARLVMDKAGYSDKDFTDNMMKETFDNLIKDVKSSTVKSIGDKIGKVKIKVPTD